MFMNDQSNRPLNIEQMFTHLKLQWQAPSPRTEEGFSELSNRLSELMHELQNSTSLEYLTKQFYPEWRVFKQENTQSDFTSQAIFRLPDTTSNEFRQGFYFCNRLIQLMEDVYLDLDLETFYDHPDNRGWINLFRHWSWSPMFQASWTISACTYGIRFQSFCRRMLNLLLGQVTTQPVDYSQIADSTLNAYEQLQVKTIYQTYNQQQTDLQLYLLNLHVPSPFSTKHQQQFLLPIFNFGYTITVSETANDPETILMYRIQDHLRKLGLGSAGLFHLVSEQTTSSNGGIMLEPGYLEEFGLTVEQSDSASQQHSIPNKIDTSKILNNPLFNREITKQSVAQFLRMLDSAKAKQLHS